MSLSILVLTEDSGDGAYETITALARQMLRLLDPGCQTQRIRFEPLTSEQARLAVQGNLWKSRQPGDQSRRQELLRTLASKLLEGDRSLVFFHIDGDCAWTGHEKGRASSENLTKFAEFKRELARLIDMFLQQQRRPAPPARPVERLLVLAPFWCIEAWVYQNTDQALRLCRERYDGKDVARFLAWQAERGLLDELPRPKRETCLAARHNQELATQGFPAAAVYAVGKSFAATVNQLSKCEPLCRGLAETQSPGG